MKYKVFSYRFAEEILEHPNHNRALNEIYDAVKECPLFIFPNKSKKNKKIYVVQQMLNTFFDRKFVDLKWMYHPLATKIKSSLLKADFKKQFENLTIQMEVQFGNMSRWYTDIFKFQAAYSQQSIDVGVCIVPVNELAKIIDSNVTYYERIIKELPSAKLSITLPILVIGVEFDENKTKTFDISNCSFINNFKKDITQNEENRRRIVNGYIEGYAANKIPHNFPPGKPFKH